MRKLFGQIDLTWKKLILFAVIAGVYTGVVAALPFTKDTSFADISITFEWWVLFGILIIVNCRAPLESGLKCIVFFLISQPLVYLVQVPFNPYGWGIFRYYPGWFRWTLLTFPMGYVGYFMKRNRWWSLLILVPMLFFVGYHYMSFLTEARSFFPNHLLSALFCAATMIIYPLCIFENKKLRIAGLIISILILAAGTVFALMTEKHMYSTEVLSSGGSLGVEFDDSYQVSLEDPSYGSVSIVYMDSIDAYMVHADFEKTGETKLILESPEGERHVFSLTVQRSSYRVEEITQPGA